MLELWNALLYVGTTITFGFLLSLLTLICAQVLLRKIRSIIREANN